MAESSGQSIEQTITDRFISLNLSQDSNDYIISETIEDLKDKCESIVNNYTNDDSQECQSISVNDYCRTVDSEAEDEPIKDKADNRPEPQYDVRVIDRLKAMASTQSTETELIKCTVINTEPKELVTTDDKIRKELTLHPQRNNSCKPKTEKWGESVGIVDGMGRNRRVISLDELNNWILLESWGQSTQSKIYCSLINERYPRFFDSTIEYYQRWRMRYNIFADKVMADADDPSIVHIGELHLYFDLMPRSVTPYYVNNSFYANPINAEKPVLTDAIEQIKSVLDCLRKSQAIFQLKFPIRSYLFHNPNHIYDKFIERQHEMMEEARSVHRKGIMRSQKRITSRDFSPPAVKGQTVRSGRDFGQNSRYFHQMGRHNRGRGRDFNDSNKGLVTKDRNQSHEYQFNGTQNRRASDGIRGSRSFRASNRNQFQSRGRPKQQNRRNKNDENEVMFEDTRDRQTNNAKTFGKTRKGMNRNDNSADERRMDGMFNERRVEPFVDKQDGGFNVKRDSIYDTEESNRQNNSYSVESDYRRFKRDFRPKDKFSSTLGVSPTAGPLFQEFSELSCESAHSQSLDGYGQPPTNARHSSSIN